MKNPLGKAVVIGGSVGTILQCFGIIRGLALRTTELDLFWAIVGYSIGTLVWMATLESFLLTNRRCRVWSLLAPLGILAAGVLLPKMSRDPLLVREPADSPMRPLYQRIAGLILVVMLTVGFIWAGSQWFRRNQWPPRAPERVLRRNETETVARLRTLIEAQHRYREVDWDGDGEKQYAPFLVHLWRSVDTGGHAIEVHLLPRAFAIAMSPAWAVDGYYFTDLRRRQLPPASTESDGITSTNVGPRAYADIDFHHGWAVSATPVAYGETGFLTFIADQTGTIWGKDQKAIQTFYPNEPKYAGWVAITDEGALERLQASITYEP